MPKTSTDMMRHALNGPTMGTRWSALFFTPAGFDPAPLQQALQAAVAEVDQQMSGWKPDSDLMRINQAPVGTWIEAPRHLMEVLRLGLAIGKASGGAFDVALGDAVTAWGFGPGAASGERIRIALSAPRRPGYEVIELGEGRLRKHGAITLDLHGIAKGYGVDRLAETLQAFGITSFLAGIDGEMRAAGLRPDGEAWTIAVEMPDHARRAAHSVLALADAAVATSGDYRHFVDVGGRRLSHTMDPRRGAPLAASPASVSVVARTCAEADGWATALMVLGPEQGAAMAAAQGLSALFLTRAADGGVIARPAGAVFA
ncbi:FAD:protein FMN transferase [Aestuariivirga litoralis]|uniref:FAD:protein FMN transferase n=1 Tax=Aestuariivirga litoralis TaxID=2650924 RepID=A0A2W2BF93_9HYPH|nr:FAD:protein FMN transferase [Aestuariivirga litoralis]PZF78914.1 FAD:protein FMN transferase [Aestuariivirga litoralis]